MFFVSLPSPAAACGIPEYQWVLFIAYQWADYRLLSQALSNPALSFTKPIMRHYLRTCNSFSGKHAGWPDSHCLCVTESVSRWQGTVVPRRRATGCPLHDALRGPLSRPLLETEYVIGRHGESRHLSRFSSKLFYLIKMWLGLPVCCAGLVRVTGLWMTLWKWIWFVWFPSLSPQRNPACLWSCVGYWQSDVLPLSSRGFF